MENTAVPQILASVSTVALANIVERYELRQLLLVTIVLLVNSAVLQLQKAASNARQERTVF